MSFTAALLAVGCASATSTPNPPQTAASRGATTTEGSLLASGRQWTEKFYRRETGALWSQFTPRMQEFMKSKSGLDEFREELEGQLGKESMVVDEHVEREKDGPIYVRTATFEHTAGRFVLKIGFDDNGSINLFGVKRAGEAREAPTSYLQYVTRAPLRLPFDGEWTVAWGGRTIAQNIHAATRDQRFAYDFFIVRDGKTHRTSGQENTDYWSYGEPVVAPGAGKVVSVVDGIEDNTPGKMNAEQTLGNHVIIEHGQDEFSFLVHLKKGSLRIKAGDRVEAGTPVGACGNSGNSSEPHLHYHLQNTPLFAKGDGLPAQFRNYTSSGRFLDSGEPSRGERIIDGRR